MISPIVVDCITIPLRRRGVKIYDFDGVVYLPAIKNNHQMNKQEIINIIKAKVADKIQYFENLIAETRPSDNDTKS